MNVQLFKVLLGVSGVFVRYVQTDALYTMQSDDFCVECTANSFSVILPTAVGIVGRLFEVKNTGTGTIIIQTTSSQTLDGELTQVLSQWDCITVRSNGSNWIIV